MQYICKIQHKSHQFMIICMKKLLANTNNFGVDNK